METNTTKTPAPATCFPIYLVEGDELPADPVAMVALDAVKSGRPLTADMLVGLPVTYSIGSDRCADKIKAASDRMITLVLESGHVFRWSKKYGRYIDGSRRLTLGIAEDYRDPSF